MSAADLEKIHMLIREDTLNYGQAAMIYLAILLAYIVAKDIFKLIMRIRNRKRERT